MSALLVTITGSGSQDSQLVSQVLQEHWLILIWFCLAELISRPTKLIFSKGFTLPTSITVLTNFWHESS